MTAEKIVGPGGTLGILGGGQLGRMLALAAAELGIASHIYAPEADSPAFAVARQHTVGAWDDQEALKRFAAGVDVVTFEFENVPVETAMLVAELVPFHPNPEALAIAQDRLYEKRLMDELGVAVPAYAEVESLNDIYAALGRTSRPAALKTRRFGYDGKGQAVVRTGDDPVVAWRMIGEAPAILESFVSFERELSVLVARGADGGHVAYDVAENRHRNHILSTTQVPAAIPAAVAAEAVDIALRTAEALSYVGVLAVELFQIVVRGAPQLLVNEIAPRVHNSFHWTQDACLVSQFEQHVRAVCGWPLVEPRRHSDVEMTNLIGEAAGDWEKLAGEAGARLHLYGKAETRPGRKMGHINRIRPRSG